MRIIYDCFPGGKNKALTMSYDDGKIEDRRLVRLFNDYGIKGTFNLNSGLTEDRIPREEWKTLYQGHEIACHTALHPTMERCTNEHLALELLEDRKALEEITGAPVRGLAYPNGSFDGRSPGILETCGIRYARTVNSSHDFSMPKDYSHWNPTCSHKDPALMSLADEFLGLFKKQYMYLFYVWGHSWNFTQDDNWDLCERFLERIAGKEEIWYATNIEIADYMDAASRMQVAVDASFAYNPSAIPVWLMCWGQGAVECLPGRVTKL